MTDGFLEDIVETKEAAKTPVHYADSNNRVYSFDCQETANDFGGVDGLILIEDDIKEWVASNPQIEKLTEEETLEARVTAYASRSDKFFLEAMRKDVEGDTEGAEEARSLGLSEVALIKEEYPL